MLSFTDLYCFLGRISKRTLHADDRACIETFISQDPPWEELLVLAEMNGVAGFFYRHLAGVYRQALPEPVRSKAATVYHQTVQTNSQLVAALEGLGTHLQVGGTSTIALQGMSVLEHYQDPGLRPLGDIDLLVRPGIEKKELLRLLAELGFRPVAPHYPDLVECAGVRFDIHTHPLGTERITSREFLFPGNLESLWARAKPLEDGNDAVLVPADLDNIILLAAHALKHGYQRIIWLADIYLCFQHLISTAPYLGKLKRRAESLHQLKSLAYAIELAARICCGINERQRIIETYPYRLNAFEKRLITLKANGWNSEILPHLLWLQNIDSYPKQLRFIGENLIPRKSVRNQIAKDRGIRHPGLMIPMQVWRGTRLLAEMLLLRGRS